MQTSFDIRNAPASCAKTSSSSGSTSPRHGNAPYTLSTDGDTRSRAEYTCWPRAHPDDCAPLDAPRPVLAEAVIHTRAITTQRPLPGDKGLQNRDDHLGIHLFQLKICMMTCPVLYHYHRNIIPSGSTGSPFTTMMSRLTR